MKLRVRAAHEDGFRTLEIRKYSSQNLNFALKIGNFLTYNGKVVEICISNFGFFVVIALKLGWWQLCLHIGNLQ